jgi:hypothetical protein
MHRRRFLQTLGLGGLAGLGGNVFGTPLAKGPTGTLSGAHPLLQGSSSPLASRMPQLISHGSAGLRTTGTQLGKLIRDLPRLAGSDDLQTAFGGKLWDMLSAHLPPTAADVVGTMAGHWGSPRVEQAVARLAPLQDATKFVHQAATEVGYPTAQLDLLVARAKHLPDIPMPKAPLPHLDSAIDSLIASTALRDSLNPLRKWSKSEDINILEGLRAGFRGLVSEPEHFATLIDTGFNAAAGILGPAVTAANIPSVALPPGLLAPTDASGRGSSSRDTAAKTGFFLAEIPFNLAVITLDCAETAIALDLPRIKLVLEGASFVSAYGGGWLYGRPPLRTYQNDCWAIMSFGQDFVLNILKRRRKELGRELLDMIWGFVGAACLEAYLIGLIIDPRISRPGLAVTRVTAGDRDPWSWGPQTIWSFLTHVLCRWAAPVANPEFWPVYMLPLWWMSVYLAGSLCEFGLWYSDWLNA